MKPALLSRPYVRWLPGNVSVVCDGNSLTYGALASSSAAAYPSVLATLAPVSTAGVSPANFGVSGQTAAQMLSDHSDVDGAWVEGRSNVLVAWELTNSLYYGRTSQQAVDDLLAYVDSIKAVHPWLVAVMTGLPIYNNRAADSSFTQTEVDALNALMDSANALLRVQWQGRASALIDLRATGSPFAFGDYLSSTFVSSGLYVPQSVTGGTAYVHCNDAGYAEVARLVAKGLSRMPAR